jgi:hypothetical protein
MKDGAPSKAARVAALAVGVAGLALLLAGLVLAGAHAGHWLTQGDWPAEPLPAVLHRLGHSVPQVGWAGVQKLIDAAMKPPADLLLVGTGWALATASGLIMEKLEKKAAAARKALDTPPPALPELRI